MTLYEHTQIGHVIIWSLLAIILIASGGFAGLSHREIPLVVSIILLVYVVLFYKLRITIEDETLQASFGPDIIRQESAACGDCRMRAHSHSLVVGLGIHHTPYGWLYNVSGFDAVAITLRDGRKFAVGTDDPHGLITAILAGFRECTLH